MPTAAEIEALLADSRRLCSESVACDANVRTDVGI